MDGIFGVGLPEMLIIALALFIVGGPRNTAKWARELGVWARKARQAWSQVVTEMEHELGPEGKEVLDAARELGKGVNDMRSMNPTRRAMNETLRMVGDMTDVKEERPALAALPARTVSDSEHPVQTNDSGAQTESDRTNGHTTPSPDSGAHKYAAWIPKDNSQ